ncbi:MAG: hypothetical protein OEY06_04485 [Gammaproteobacteria bacterium]|nr:hypothetical protein [Gammaproteobacteria bacterium]
MMEVQHKITSFGLNQHDQVILKSFLKVINLDPSLLWVYSDEDNAEVVIVDFEQDEGKEFIYNCEIGMYSGKVMVSIGENVSGVNSAYSISRPLNCSNLHKVFDELIDSNGSLISSSI